jgi:hypothetical protein
MTGSGYSGWIKTFTDPSLCAAIVDRLTFNRQIIETGTTSYRFAHGRVARSAPENTSALPNPSFSRMRPRNTKKQDCNFCPTRPIIRVMSAPLPNPAPAPSATAEQLRHVRWLVGGTGSGKSTVTAVLARRFDLDIYSGDRAEHDWLTRCSPQRHPHFAALSGHRPGDNWRDRSPQQAFAAMAGRYGETIEFLIEDLSARSADRIVLVDYFGVLPRDLSPLLSWPAQAAFLLPTPDFRRAGLTRRYADPDRARANWGNLDAAKVLETRLERDALWDVEVTEQAKALGLPLRIIDGTRPPADLADDLAEGFKLTPVPD